jgi:excinuclease ABC subunit A
LLYARVGQPRCPHHHHTLEAQTVSQMVDAVLAYPEETRLMILAPVVQSRKGEHEQILDKLRSQGYVRARIDGKVVELDEAPKLDLRKKHDIAVIVDRIKVRKDLQQRLAESFETALNLAGGIAYVAMMDKPKEPDRVFSSKFACPECGYSLAELEPRLFSFNNPAGACPSCDGLGVKQFFDPAKVLHDPELSLAGGAIRGWDRRNLYYFQLLSSLAAHYRFDIEKPFKDLRESVREKILYGSGNERIIFSFVNDHGRKMTKTHPFEGVIPNMERRYKETESNSVREDLAKYLTTSHCPECQGARLKLEARHVFIQDFSLPQITALSVSKTLDFFQNLTLAGRRGEIASRILKEINDRLGFLVSVGLDYLTLDRSADTLSGGEAQRIRLASQIGSGLVGVMYILDEPSIGLHQRDNERLLNTLIRLRDLGNTVIVVEHDEDAIRNADHLVDIGPGAGVHGGQVIAQGTPQDIINNTLSLTGQYLAGKLAINVPQKRTPMDPKRLLKLHGATCNNLKNVDVRNWRIWFGKIEFN